MRRRRPTRRPEAGRRGCWFWWCRAKRVRPEPIGPVVRHLNDGRKRRQTPSIWRSMGRGPDQAQGRSTACIQPETGTRGRPHPRQTAAPATASATTPVVSHNVPNRHRSSAMAATAAAASLGVGVTSKSRGRGRTSGAGWPERARPAQPPPWPVARPAAAGSGPGCGPAPGSDGPRNAAAGRTGPASAHEPQPALGPGLPGPCCRPTRSRPVKPCRVAFIEERACPARFGDRSSAGRCADSPPAEPRWSRRLQVPERTQSAWHAAALTAVPAGPGSTGGCG